MAIPAQARRCVTMSPNVIATDAGVTAVYVAAGVQRGTVEVRARVFDAALVPLGSPAAVHRSPAVDQFQAAAALDRTSGLIWACYYDTGGDSSRTHARFKCTASRDSGRNWATPVPAASVPSNESMYPATPFQFGDYQGLAIGADGRAHALWTDSRDIGRAGEQIYATSLSSSDLGF
jgi:hypothetical protein